jgi:hypothetical protein
LVLSTVIPFKGKYRQKLNGDTAIRNAKPQNKQYKLTDEKGMYLLVDKAGKYFRLDYRFADKRKTLTLGVEPTPLPIEILPYYCTRSSTFPCFGFKKGIFITWLSIPAVSFLKNTIAV